MSSVWHLKTKDLKRYPHFDAVKTVAEAIELATNPQRVARHEFYPFMLYVQRWTKFAEKGGAGKAKERPIRYAARADAYIFSYYRHILSERYEAELAKLELQDCVLACRRIPSEDGGGKCNIHFARDAFAEVVRQGDCAVLTLDISSYFESLDHARLKALWCRLLETNKLPTDHFQVFKAITRYAVVDKRDIYVRLGHFGEKRKSKAGNPINGYLTPFREIPRQLSNGKQFRDLIKPSAGSKGIVKINHKPYGIPQGAPLSDLLANLYLIEFDLLVSTWAAELGGRYYRYSDDILIAVPGGETVAVELMERVRTAIRSFGSKLKIKQEKTSIFVFSQSGDRQTCARVFPSKPCNGLEYLGFRFDGRRIYIRDSTLSNLYRKVTRAARREANACARRYRDKDETELKLLFPYEKLTKKFGRVELFDEIQDDYRKWTFWTYAQRAAKVFGPQGRAIGRQLANLRQNIRDRAKREIVKSVERRSAGKI